MKECDENIQKTIQLTKTMLELSDKGDLAREDPGCAVLYAVLRDSAYKIRQLAESEKEAHIKKGWWTSKRLPSRKNDYQGGKET